MIVAPSILAANPNALGEEIALIKELGAQYVHIDIMDGKFVPNKTWDPSIMDEISLFCSDLIKDVHIMVTEPWILGGKFAKKGADIVTFHIEAINNEFELRKTIDAIRENGAKVGVSIKPGTSVEKLLPILDEIDLVLVMSVEPGKGGQKFIENSLEKISFLRAHINKEKLSCLIEVDGGINGETGKRAFASGADILVAGSYLFGHEDIKERMDDLLCLA